MERRIKDGKGPLNDMIADIEKYTNPVGGDIDAGIDCLKIKQANAEARSERGERYSGEKKKTA